MEENRFALWFDEIGIEDVPSVGGKNASLGEMYRELSGKGIKVPLWICCYRLRIQALP